MGKALHKMYGRQEVKSHTRTKNTPYYYENMMYVSDDCRAEMGEKVQFPPYFSVEFEHELIKMYVPTMFVYNSERQEFKIFYSQNTSKYWILFRDIDIPTTEYGIGSFSEFDQMFIASIQRICQGLVICQGRSVVLPAGRKTSTNLFEATIGSVGPNNTVMDQCVSVFSKNCIRVLPLTCELKNKTWRFCVHDINQRICQLAKGGFLTQEKAAKMLKRQPSEEDEQDREGVNSETSLDASGGSARNLSEETSREEGDEPVDDQSTDQDVMEVSSLQFYIMTVPCKFKIC